MYRDDFIPERTQPTRGNAVAGRRAGISCAAARVEEEKRSSGNRFLSSLAKGNSGRNRGIKGGRLGVGREGRGAGKGYE